MPDPTPRIRFSSVFPKKAWITLCKTDQDPIWMAWSRFGQTHLVCRNHLVRFLAGRNLPATSFPLSDSVPFFHRRPTDNIVQNRPGSDLVLAACVSFWPNGSGPEASRCAGIIRPASGQCFPADPDRMRVGSSMLTGIEVGF